jgi:hypothetical protein
MTLRRQRRCALALQPSEVLAHYCTNPALTPTRTWAHTTGQTSRFHEEMDSPVDVLGRHGATLSVGGSSPSGRTYRKRFSVMTFGSSAGICLDWY